ncbi:MAG TPA: ATP-binding protein [Actinomycetota bacterium]|nr:ATP-binding protein [Actinomycetota bacterium]
MTAVSDTTFLLEFPPQAPYVSTARIFAAAVARHFGVDEDSVDDLKIAVSEACTSAIRARRDGLADGPVRLEALVEGSRLVFLAKDAGVPEGDGAQAALEGGSSWDRIANRLGLETIRALFPQAEVLAGDGRTGDLRFGLDLGSPAPK